MRVRSLLRNHGYLPAPSANIEQLNGIEQSDSEHEEIEKDGQEELEKLSLESSK